MTLAGTRSVSEYVKGIPELKLSIDYDGKLKRGSQDMLMKAYFKEKRMKYVQWNKTMVQHKIEKSVMYPKSSRRTDEN